jgi:hypothetical protein
MTHTNQTLLFLISGEAKQLLAIHALPEGTIIQPFAEKDLTTSLQTLKRLRQAKGKIFFGTKVLRLQRYRLIIKTLLFLSGKTSAVPSLTKVGERETYSWIHFIFVDFWRLLAEAIASVFVLIRTALELQALKRKTKLRT